MTFQQLLLSIQGFWAERGCVLQQPYDLEVGAGTMHPDTFFRVLGPEPWRVAYCQPSRRPADGRFGENPAPEPAAALRPAGAWCADRGRWAAHRAAARQR